MKQFAHIFREIALEQDQLRARSDARERLAEHIESEPLPRFQFNFGRLALVGTVAALLLAIGAWRLWPEPALGVRVGVSGAPGLAGAFLGAPESATLPLEFSDGTRFELRPKARARLAELYAEGARVELESGRIHVHVVPRSHARWLLDAGPFRVVVKGTRFDVSYDRSRDEFELVLHEGEVMLEGCVFGKGRSLAAGQVVRASCRAATLQVDYAEQPSQPQASTPAVAPPNEPALASSATPIRPKSEPSHGDAPSANADELLLEAQSALRTGSTPRASEALLGVRRRFPSSKQAALAAYRLGQLEFDGNHAYPRAAEWFRTYLREQPNGSLKREALGRLLEAVDRSNQTDAAAELAARYLREYPSGPHSELAARIVAR